MSSKKTHDYLVNHFSCLRKYKPSNNVVENIVININKLVNILIRNSHNEKTRASVGVKSVDDKVGETLIVYENAKKLMYAPYIIRMIAPTINIIFPKFDFIISSDFNIYNLVLKLSEVISN